MLLVRLQLPITLTESSEPEPDIALVKLEPTDYENAHPTAADVLLIIEVADSTLAGDLTIKNTLYAQAGIEDYWVLDVKNQQLHVLREPTETGYQSVEVLDKNQAIAPVAFPESPIQIADILSPQQTKD